MRTSEKKGQGNTTESEKNKDPKSHSWSIHAAIFITPSKTKDLDGTNNIIFDDFCYAMSKLSTSDKECERAHYWFGLSQYQELSLFSAKCMHTTNNMHLFLNVDDISLETQMFSSCLSFLVSCSLAGLALQG